MKTIGTITFHDATNYGALLQAYALQKTLGGMGHVSEIIDYCSPQRGLIGLSRFHRMKHFLWDKVVKRVLGGTKRRKHTEDFRRRHLCLSTKKYVSAETLHLDPPRYDAYITGSDQVWNPTTSSNDSSYFLSFAPPGKRLIAYGASFGVSKLKAKYISDYQGRIKRIHWLSTREIEGRSIIYKLTGRDAEIVLDPTLLIKQEQWSHVAIPYDTSAPYILCYYMPGDKEVNRSITMLAQQVASLSGWKIICIGQKEYIRFYPGRRSVFNAGPAEFLGLLQNASFVVTNSFHGTAFSINFKKPFIVPINMNLPPGKALNSRITSLLKAVGLEDRQLPAGSNLIKKDQLEVDFSEATVRLEKERMKSIAFLHNALQGI